MEMLIINLENVSLLRASDIFMKPDETDGPMEVISFYIFRGPSTPVPMIRVVWSREIV